MPAISMFFGIVIAIYFKDTKQHNLPHIHARYQDFKAVYAIADGQLLDGDLPPRQTRLVQAWMEIHRDALDANWALAVSGQEPFRIPPLQ